jgi:hypothetical protein
VPGTPLRGAHELNVMSPASFILLGINVSYICIKIIIIIFKRCAMLKFRIVGVFIIAFFLPSMSFSKEYVCPSDKCITFMNGKDLMKKWQATLRVQKREIERSTNAKQEIDDGTFDIMNSQELEGYVQGVIDAYNGKEFCVDGVPVPGGAASIVGHFLTKEENADYLNRSGVEVVLKAVSSVKTFSCER